MLKGGGFYEKNCCVGFGSCDGTVITYDDQGFIVTTYEFTDEGLTETDMEGAIREIESEMASDAPMPLASGPTATASKKFNTSEHSPTDVSLTASQSGTFCKSIDNNYAYLWVVGGVSKAAYTSPDYTPSSIYITETFETTGLQVSVSWPPAVTSGSKIYERTLGPYNNVNFVTLNWLKSVQQADLQRRFLLVQLQQLMQILKMDLL